MASSIPSVIDRLEVPAELTAHVISPGWRPLLHGYDVQADLARHYGFAELVLTALTGDAPEPAAGHLFEVALVFAAPTSVAEAPTHAAMLARLCGARPAGVLSVAAIALSEQVRTLVTERAGLLAWLDAADCGTALPAGCSSDDAEEKAAVSRLRAALAARGVAPAILEAPLGLAAAIIATLHAAGLRAAWQIEAALCFARWPLAVAEAMAARAGDLKSYPIRLPAFELDEVRP
jgi:hypothetical protein